MKIGQYEERFRFQNRDTSATFQAGNYNNIASSIANNANASQIQGLGRVVEGFTGALVQNIDARQNAKVEEAINGMQTSFTDWKTQQTQKHGKDALTTLEDYEAFRTQSIEDLTRNMNPTERARFDSRAQTILANQSAWSAEYEYGEEQKYLDDTAIASYENSTNSIIANPEFFNAEMERITNVAIETATRKGYSEEQTNAYVREQYTKAFGSIVTARINENNLGAAQSSLEKGKGFMGEEEYTYYESLIRSRREQNKETIKRQNEENSEANAQIALDNTMFMYLDKNKNYETIEEQYSATIDDIRNDFSSAEDKEKRDELLAMAKKEYDALKLSRGAHAQAELIGFQKDVQGMTSLQIQDYWAKTDKTKISYESKQLIKDFITGKNEEETIENREATQAMLVAIDERYDDNGRLYSDDDLLKIFAQNSFTTKQKGQITSYARNAGAEGMLKQTTISTAYKTAFGDSAKKDIPQEFIDFVKKNLPHGREADQAEINRIAARYRMDGSNRAETGWFGSQKGLTYAEAFAEDKLDVWLPEVEDDEVESLSNELRNLDIKVTENNMAKYKKMYWLNMEDDSSFE